MGGDLLHLLDDLVGGGAQCRAANGHGAGSIRAAPVGDGVSIALYQADFLERHTEPGMDHLGIGCLVTLSVAVGTGDDRYRAGLVKPDFHPVVKRRGKVDKRTHADATQLSAGCGLRLAGRIARQVGDLGRVFGDAGEIARIVDRGQQRGERHLFLGDVVALADFHRIDTHLARCDIEQAFDHVDRLGASRATIGPGPGGVAEHDADMDMHRLVFIDIGIHHRADTGGHRRGGRQVRA